MSRCLPKQILNTGCVGRSAKPMKQMYKKPTNPNYEQALNLNKLKNREPSELCSLRKDNHKPDSKSNQRKTRISE